MTNLKADRLIGLIFLAAGLWYGYLAVKFEVSALMDPVGPRVFPLILAAILTFLSLLMIIKPKTKGIDWPGTHIWIRIGLTILSLVLYAYLLAPLGFVLSTALVMTALSVIFKGPLVKGAITSLLFSIALFSLFDTLLGLNIPTGLIFDFFLG